MVILSAEWQEVLRMTWNSEIPLVFAHVVFTKTLGVRRAKEIHSQINRRMELWERVRHAGLVGEAEAEGGYQGGQICQISRGRGLGRSKELSQYGAVG